MGVGSKDLLSMTLRAILRSMIMRRVRVHGFTAPCEATGRRYCGLDLAWNRYGIVVGSVGRTQGILWDGEAGPGSSVDILIGVRLLLRLVRAWVAWRQVCGHGGLLWDVGGRNRSDVVHVRVHVSGRLLLLLGILVTVLLDGRSDCRDDGLDLRLERLS